MSFTDWSVILSRGQPLVGADWEDESGKGTFDCGHHVVDGSKKQLGAENENEC